MARIGIFESVIDRVKKNYDASQAEKKRKQDIYKEAYQKAEIDAIQKKAVADAKAKYAPPAKVTVSPEEAKRRAEKAQRMNPFGRF